ncbi:hypothetical protein BDZ97DRAFT_1823129 [Flammula alnicola]|nr:hypothetical protein BDZ97DRAFT_1842946 [Flammula alnicola]KAF8958183.1 hypothetical protein BDZ97DRAFT_1842947 [Flammula alnicola]KAF8959985.1 hypothetical protein BDZ97DRAFT_1835910 [Flammula alnicola]KAF8962851.1 hypothetical protein BDZ97DRAFT_1823129 [Flammula alnicola]
MTKQELREFHDSMSHMYPYETPEQYCETVEGLAAIRKRQAILELESYRSWEQLKVRIDRCRNSLLDLLEQA